MRGPDERQAVLFSYRSIEDRIPDDHPHRYRGRRTSAVDDRTTRHRSYTISQRKRKLIEQGSGWQKCVAPPRKLHHRGSATVSWIFAFTSAAHDLVRLRTLFSPQPT